MHIFIILCLFGFIYSEHVKLMVETATCCFQSKCLFFNCNFHFVSSSIRVMVVLFSFRQQNLELNLDEAVPVEKRIARKSNISRKRFASRFFDDQPLYQVYHKVDRSFLTDDENNIISESEILLNHS